MSPTPVKSLVYFFNIIRWQYLKYFINRRYAFRKLWLKKRKSGLALFIYQSSCFKDEHIHFILNTGRIFQNIIQRLRWLYIYILCIATELEIYILHSVLYKDLIQYNTWREVLKITSRMLFKSV